jgi:hypothetical protein
MPINFEVVKENFGNNPVHDAYAEHEVIIHLNNRLCQRLQADGVIHEVIESYLPLIPHEKVDDITDSIMNALDDVIKWDYEGDET